MNPRTSATSARLVLVATLTLGLVHQAAPWPALQTILHAFLVIGLAPLFRSFLVGALWASAAGWVLEGTLRVYPHLGGTALANMIVALLAAWTLVQWPPQGAKAYWIRLGAFAVLHLLLVNVLVYFTAGAHVWGWGPIWTLVLVPLWAGVAYKLYVPHYRE